MKRFLITSPRYEGEAVLYFNADGLLQKIDCSFTNMDAATIGHFKKAAPVNMDDLTKAFLHPTIVVESEYQISFDMFWKKYDHKFNRPRAEQLYNRLSKTEKVLAYFGLDKYHKYLRKNPLQAKLHPDTYLRNKAWLNDYK